MIMIFIISLIIYLISLIIILDRVKRINSNNLINVLLAFIPVINLIIAIWILIIDKSFIDNLSVNIKNTWNKLLNIFRKETKGGSSKNKTKTL